MEIFGYLWYCNLVFLFGYCVVGGECFFVYKYMFNGFVWDCLYFVFGKLFLSWFECVRVVIGVV